MCYIPQQEFLLLHFPGRVVCARGRNLGKFLGTCIYFPPYALFFFKLAFSLQTVPVNQVDFCWVT